MTEQEKEISQATETAETVEETTAEVSELQQAKERLVVLQAELEEQKDRYLRLQADYDNYRRRTQKEKLRYCFGKNPFNGFWNLKSFCYEQTSPSTYLCTPSGNPSVQFVHSASIFLCDVKQNVK